MKFSIIAAEESEEKSLQFSIAFYGKNSFV
jgi:hypothetical protein